MLSYDPLPRLQYPQGASRPDAIITAADAGDFDLFDTVALVVAEGVPGTSVLFTVTDLTLATDSVTVGWSPSDLGSLNPGTYGLTLVAILDGEEQKWRGQLEIVEASRYS